MINIIAVASREQDGSREYRLSSQNGHTDFISAESRQDALCKYYERIIDRLRTNIAEMTPIIPLATIGAALRNGGIAVIDRASGYPADYIAAAGMLGYMAETHTVGAMTYLRIGSDRAALDALKGQLDRVAKQ